MLKQISARDLHERLASSEPPVVLDVREPAEIAIARMPGALEIPMNDVPGRFDEIPADRDVVVVCHHGMRSAQVASFLADRGHARVLNLAGGIDAWSLQVDASVRRY
ncbi:MAG: rhodanese-like domain-containing protein [Alphaproteobacteria bacterium]